MFIARSRVQLQELLEELLEEDESGKGGGGPVIRAEVAVRLKGRKNEALDDEEDGELNNTVWGKETFICKSNEKSRFQISLDDSEIIEKKRNLIMADVVIRLRKPRNPQGIDLEENAINLNQRASTMGSGEDGSGGFSTDSGETG